MVRFPPCSSTTFESPDFNSTLPSELLLCVSFKTVSWVFNSSPLLSMVTPTSTVPASVTAATADKALEIARRVVDSLGYVGVSGVEMFVTGSGADEDLLVNEIAPRVHNSGHWTQDACLVSQFEQHMRAVAGWPLGNPARHSDVVMENLIGADAEGWAAVLAEPGARLHLYGKAEIRQASKMGHVNRIRPKAGG